MDLEPYPIDQGEPLWESGSPQWLERYEYIEARAERYFDVYRDNPEYDFTRTLGDVNRQQTATQLAYERFASGELKLLGVQAQVKMLRDAYKRKVATPMTPEERAASKPEYVPQWRKDWDAKKAAQREQQKAEALKNQPSPDHGRFILLRAYRGATETGTPMPGVACYSIDQDEGWTETGERVSKGRGYLLVLWDCHEYYYPDKPGRPDILIAGYEKPETPVTQSRTLDDLRAERSKQEHDISLEKLERRLSRGRRK